MLIIPSVLTNSREEYELLMSGVIGVERVHIDFIDGEFADNKTILPNEVNPDDHSDLMFDAHLMVANRNIKEWVDMSIEMGFDRIITHAESIEDMREYITYLHDREKHVGIAIDLETEIPHSDDLHGVDVVLVMSVKAGFGGQDFETIVLDKVRELSKMRDSQSLDFAICVDGGVSKENIKDIFDAGADEVSVGRRLFKGDMQDNIDELTEVANNG